MFDIKYRIVGKRTAEGITKDDKIMDGFEVITDLQMIPKLLRSMAVLQGKLELTDELQREREDILAWLLVHHK